MSELEELKRKFNLSDEDLKKPLPTPTKWSKPFWEGTKKHKLLLKRHSQWLRKMNLPSKKERERQILILIQMRRNG